MISQAMTDTALAAARDAGYVAGLWIGALFGLAVGVVFGMAVLIWVAERRRIRPTRSHPLTLSKR